MHVSWLWKSSVVLLPALWLCSGFARAEDPAKLQLLHPLFTEGAVLQRGIEVPVWGWAEPGAKVTVTFRGQEKKAVADAGGKWLVRLSPMRASSDPADMRVSFAVNHEPLTISGVLVGDIWLCSGQSNMEWPVSSANDAQKEIAAADHPLIRLFTVPKKISFEPEATVNAKWQPCTPATIGGFSAVGYFFGRTLQEDLKVPVGLINSSWGGTIAEAWISPDSLAAIEDFRPALAQVAMMGEAGRNGGQDKLLSEWLRAKDPGSAGEWFKPETDVTSWKEVDMPKAWEAIGLGSYDGIAWFQRTFEAPATWAGKDLVLSLGPIDDIDTTWFNGALVGQKSLWNEPRVYRVPGSSVKAGLNTVAIRVIDTSGGGGLIGTPAQLKVHPAGEEAAAVSLAGPWRMKETATAAQIQPLPTMASNNPNVCTVLYNGMIAPLTPFPIKGAIWYQGESNAGRAYQYRTLLPTLVRDWRARFGAGEIGFHIVQLANFMERAAQPRDNDWAELREAQSLTAKTLPNCGIASAIDIGDAADIHPRNKQEVGRRLALSALAVTYDRKDVECSGPWYRSMSVANGGVRLSFDHATGGLTAKGDKLAGFSIAGEDRKFVWADAAIDGDIVVASSPAVPDPVAVRYAWDANPAAGLYNGAGLPAVPFRTDEWPGITVNNK
jgi:sialate O-acetylesterase